MVLGTFSNADYFCKPCSVLCYAADCNLAESGPYWQHNDPSGGPTMWMTKYFKESYTLSMFQVDAMNMSKYGFDSVLKKNRKGSWSYVLPKM